MSLDGDLAFERPKRNFHLLQAIDARRARRTAYASKTQNAPLQIHPQVFTPYTGHLETHDHFGRGLENVRCGLPPIPPQAVGKFAV